MPWSRCRTVGRLVPSTRWSHWPLSRLDRPYLGSSISMINKCSRRGRPCLANTSGSQAIAGLPTVLSHWKVAGSSTWLPPPRCPCFERLLLPSTSCPVRGVDQPQTRHITLSTAHTSNQGRCIPPDRLPVNGPRVKTLQWKQTPWKHFFSWPALTIQVIILPLMPHRNPHFGPRTCFRHRRRRSEHNSVRLRSHPPRRWHSPTQGRPRLPWTRRH
jgi:hypothetical protein